MKTRVFLLCIVLVFSAKVYPELTYDNFFIVEDHYSKTNTGIGSNVSFNSLSMNTHVRDVFTFTPSVSYKGKLIKPFSVTDPLQENHDILCVFPFKNIDLGFRTGVEIYSSKYRFADETSDITIISDSVRNYYQKVTSSQVNHSALEYCLSGNLGIKQDNFYLALNCIGKIHHQRGYAYNSRNYNNQEITHYIQEYEPDNISYSLAGGLFAAVPFVKHAGSHLIFLEANGEHTDFQAPISANIEFFKHFDSQYSTKVIYSGSVSKIREFSFNSGMVSELAIVTKKEQLLLPGNYLFGITLDRLSFSGVFQKIWKSEQEYVYNVASSNADTAKIVTTQFSNRSLSLTVKPEIYVTRNISIILPLTGDAMYGSQLDADRLLSASVSSSLKYVHFFNKNVYLSTTVHAGEFYFTRKYLYVLEYPVFYKKYKAGISIQLCSFI